MGLPLEVHCFPCPQVLRWSQPEVTVVSSGVTGWLQENIGPLFGDGSVNDALFSAVQLSRHCSYHDRISRTRQPKPPRVYFNTANNTLYLHSADPPMTNVM